MATRVSIIIPHLPGTREAFLQEALASIDRQDYPNIEVVLVNRLATEVENVQMGVEQSTGEIIHILHDDDWLPDNGVSLGVNGLQGFDLVHGNAHEVGGRDYIPRVKQPTLYELAKYNHIHNATLFYRRDLFDRVTPYEQDWLFLLRCLEQGAKIGYVNEFLKNYRLHPGSLTNSKVWVNEIRPGLEQIVQKRYKHILCAS